MGGSGMDPGIWPLLNAQRVGSELMKLMGPQAMWGGGCVGEGRGRLKRGGRGTWEKKSGMEDS